MATLNCHRCESECGRSFVCIYQPCHELDCYAMWLSVRRSQQLLTDAIFPEHSQKVQMLLCFLMTAELFADQERFVEITVPREVKVTLYEDGG